MIKLLFRLLIFRMKNEVVSRMQYYKLMILMNSIQDITFYINVKSCKYSISKIWCFCETFFQTNKLELNVALTSCSSSLREEQVASSRWGRADDPDMVLRRNAFCREPERWWASVCCCECSASWTFEGVAGGEVIGDIVSPPKSLACGDIGSGRRLKIDQFRDYKGVASFEITFYEGAKISIVPRI